MPVICATTIAWRGGTRGHFLTASMVMSQASAMARRSLFLAMKMMVASCVGIALTRRE
jgi:hypothetical protein